MCPQNRKINQYTRFTGSIPHSDANHLNELLKQHIELEQNIITKNLIHPDEMIEFNIASDKLYKYLQQRLNITAGTLHSLNKDHDSKP